MPSCCAIRSSSPDPSTFDRTSPLIGTFSPVETHELASRAVTRLLELLQQAADAAVLLQQREEHREQRACAAGGHAAARAHAARPGVAAPQPAEAASNPPSPPGPPAWPAPPPSCPISASRSSPAGLARATAALLRGAAQHLSQQSVEQSHRVLRDR